MTPDILTYLIKPPILSSIFIDRLSIPVMFLEGVGGFTLGFLSALPKLLKFENNRETPPKFFDYSENNHPLSENLTSHLTDYTYHHIQSPCILTNKYCYEKYLAKLKRNYF